MAYFLQNTSNFICGNVCKKQKNKQTNKYKKQVIFGQLLAFLEHLLGKFEAICDLS